MKKAFRSRVLILLLICGCCGPAIDIARYRYMLKDPGEAVRFFQLAVELGKWKEASLCLTSEKEEVGAIQLWVAASMKMQELGGYSLNEIVVSSFLMKEVSRHGREAVVAVLCHPVEEEVQRYDLVLVKKNGSWVIHIDKTINLNAQPPEGLP